MAKIQSTDQSARKEDLRTFLQLLLPYLGGNPSSETSNTISEDLVASKSVGGIASGTTYAQGTSFETILRDLLSEVSNPKFTNPSVNITVNSSTTMNSGQSKTVTITATFNRGSINPAYGTSGYRSGEVIGYSLNGGTEQASNIFENVTVDEQHKTFTVTARYAAGEQPKDSNGDDYDEPLSAGTVESNTITFSFETISYLWSNAADNSVVAKEQINKAAGTKTWTFAPCTEESPEIFAVPADWTVTAIESYNDFTRDFDDCSDEFTPSSWTQEGVSYRKYTDNREVDAGSRTIRIKWS